MNTFFHLPRTASLSWLRVGAVIEVLAVYAAGSVLGFILAQLLGITLRNPFPVLAQDPAQDLIPLTLDLLTILFWQYLGWALLACLMRWRSVGTAVTPPSTKMDRSAQLRFAVCAAAIVILPAQALQFVHAVFGLGTDVPWRAALFAGAWDADFWVFSAAGSFIVVALVEELFFRGYVLRRLASVCSPAFAVLASAGLFAFAHGQYQQADWLNVLSVLVVLWAGVIFALLTRLTGSLWPAIVAHSLLNLPQTVTVFLVFVPLAMLALWWTRHQMWQLFKAVGTTIRTAPGSLLVILAGAITFHVLFQRLAMPMALAGAAALLILLLLRLRFTLAIMQE